MKLTKKIGLIALTGLSIVANVNAANEADLLSLLVQNNVITAEQAAMVSSQQAEVPQSLIGLLVQNGTISQAQANTLAPAPVPTTHASSNPSVADVDPHVVPKQKTTQKIKLNGRIHFQGDYLSTDYDNAASPDDEANLFLRRIYLGASAQLVNNISATINGQFSDGSNGTAKIEKAIIGWDVTDQYNLSFGFQKVPFAFEETTSSSKINTVERSVATRYFTEQLNLGARFTGLFFSGNYANGIYFTSALTNPTQGVVNGSSSTDKLALWARAGWKGDLGSLPFNIGINGGRLQETREANVLDYVYGIYANTTIAGVGLTAEILTGDFEKGSSNNAANPFGFNLEVTYKFNKKLELVGRYSTLNADNGIGADISDTFRRAPENGGAKFDEVDAYYLGLNYYFVGNSVKLTAGYEWASFEDNFDTSLSSQGDAEVSGFRTRLQLLY